MCQFDALHGTCEDHAVIAGDSAAAQRGKADVARRSRAGMPVAAARRMSVQVDAATGVLETMAPAAVKAVPGEDGWLSVHIPPDRAAEVNRTLAGAGIYAAGLETGSDLESLFLELTGGASGSSFLFPYFLILFGVATLFPARMRWAAAAALMTPITFFVAEVVVWGSVAPGKPQQDLLLLVEVSAIVMIGNRIVTRAFFRDLAPVWPDEGEARAMADVASGDAERAARGEAALAEIPVLDAVLRNGISPVMVEGGTRHNVIPPEATATLKLVPPERYAEAEVFFG